MLTRFATRATFVADTNFVSWTQNVSENLQKHFLCPRLPRTGNTAGQNVVLVLPEPKYVVLAWSRVVACRSLLHEKQEELNATQSQAHWVLLQQEAEMAETAGQLCEAWELVSAMLQTFSQQAGLKTATVRKCRPTERCTDMCSGILVRILPLYRHLPPPPPPPTPSPLSAMESEEKSLLTRGWEQPFVMVSSERAKNIIVSVGPLSFVSVNISHRHTLLHWPRQGLLSPTSCCSWTFVFGDQNSTFGAAWLLELGIRLAGWKGLVGARTGSKVEVLRADKHKTAPVRFPSNRTGVSRRVHSSSSQVPEEPRDVNGEADRSGDAAQPCGAGAAAPVSLVFSVLDARNKQHEQASKSCFAFCLSLLP